MGLVKKIQASVERPRAGRTNSSLDLGQPKETRVGSSQEKVISKGDPSRQPTRTHGSIGALRANLPAASEQ